MRKPATLRTHLLASVPALANDPSKLDLFIDRGRLQCRRGAGLSFRYAYTLNLVVQEFAGDVDLLMLAVLAWVANNEPELLDRTPHEPFAYESEILDGTSADVSITIELTEAVKVTADANGRPIMEHLPDGPIPDSFAGVETTLRELRLFDTVTPETIITP